MGQFDTGFGGAIHLVETPADVDKLKVRDAEQVAFVTQTTLSMDDTARVIDALRLRFPKMHGPRKDDICYATQNRQDAIKKLARQCQVMLVMGSRNSSNSNRLREIAQGEGAVSYLVDGPEDLQREWFTEAKAVGVTAGASAPEVLVQRVVAQLKDWGGKTVNETQGIPENVEFALPKVLRPVSRA